MTYGYDELGRLTSVGFDTDGDSTVDETVSYEYDISGNRTTLILPNTDEINYAYDDKGRLVSMTDWDDQVSTFQYDKLGRHVGTQRSNGFTSKYAYNKAGHLQELRHGEGWNTAKTLQSFVYETDARGNRTQVKEVSLRDTAGSSVTMAHDDESIVYSGDWDANGSFHETTETNAKLAVMFYGNTGINLTMGTGDDCGIYDVYINQTLWQSYDGYASSAGEDVIALEVKGDGAHLLEVYQRREKNSASSGYKVRFKSLEALEAYEVETIDYTYDNLSRLLTANYDGGAVEYTYGYDLAGNLVNNNGVTNTFNDANQLTGDGTDTFDYDNNGNLWKTNSVVSHTWDKANRLLSHGGLDYAYDGLGNRISQDNGTNVTKYLLNLQAGLPRVLSETVDANVTQFVHSPRGLHATQNNSGNWFWGLQDSLGSQRAEIGANVAVVASQEFTPYGVVQNVSGAFNSPHAFTSEPLDANGLQYHRARYYDPAMGVWASLDPAETPNRYAYASGCPINRIDPTGMFDESTCTVEAGDYLEGIGVDIGVRLSNGSFVPGYGQASNTQLAEVRQLMRAYNPQRPGHIFPGDRLNLPPNAKGITCPSSRMPIGSEPQPVLSPPIRTPRGGQTIPSCVDPYVAQEMRRALPRGVQGSRVSGGGQVGSQGQSVEPPLPDYLDSPFLDTECQLNRAAVASNPPYLRSERVRSAGVILTGEIAARLYAMFGVGVGAGAIFAFEGNLRGLDINSCSLYGVIEGGTAISVDSGQGLGIGVAWSNSSADGWGGLSGNFSFEFSTLTAGFAGSNFGVSRNLANCDYTAFIAPSVAGGIWPSASTTGAITVGPIRSTIACNAVARIFGFTLQSVYAVTVTALNSLEQGEGNVIETYLDFLRSATQ